MNDRVIQEVTRCIKRTHCCPRFIRRRYDVSSWLTTSSVRFRVRLTNQSLTFLCSARAPRQHEIPSHRKYPYRPVAGWVHWTTVISRLISISIQHYVANVVSILRFSVRKKELDQILSLKEFHTNMLKTKVTAAVTEKKVSTVTKIKDMAKK